MGITNENRNSFVKQFCRNVMDFFVVADIKEFQNLIPCAHRISYLPESNQMSLAFHLFISRALTLWTKATCLLTKPRAYFCPFLLWVKCLVQCLTVLMLSSNFWVFVVPMRWFQGIGARLPSWCTGKEEFLTSVIWGNCCSGCEHCCRLYSTQLKKQVSGRCCGGSLIGDLAPSLVALYLFEPTDVFNTFAKRKSDC